MRILLLCCLFYCSHACAIGADLLIAVVECESSGMHNARGDSGKSYGIAQFQRATFTRFAKMAGKKNYQYHNPVHQLKLMSWAIDNGYGDHWVCYSKLAGKKSPVMDSGTKFDAN